MVGFLADECVNTDTIIAIRTAGFDVLTVNEAGLNGSDDEIIYETAKKQDRILLTFDRGFGDIFRFDIAKGPGVVIVLIGQMAREEISEIVLQFLSLPDKSELAGKLVIIGKSKIRISGDSAILLKE